MRIIGGRLKGREVEAPRGVLSRPPLSVIRESVFNILGQSIEGKSVLDLFAGSGSLGIEAISRGAAEVQFVDSSRRCAEMIERNTRGLGIADLSRIVRQDAVEFVAAGRGGPFDIVFVDPPFLSGKAEEALNVLAPSTLVSETTVVIVRTHWRERFALPAGFQVARQRKFGDSVVAFMKRTQGGTGQ
jgi:16S rRNA (guanine966-N2)-methyltransferase